MSSSGTRETGAVEQVENQSQRQGSTLPRRSLALCWAVSNKMSILTEDLVGTSEGGVTMIVTSSMDYRWAG